MGKLLNFPKTTSLNNGASLSEQLSELAGNEDCLIQMLITEMGALGPQTCYCPIKVLIYTQFRYLCTEKQLIIKQGTRIKFSDNLPLEKISKGNHTI